MLQDVNRYPGTTALLQDVNRTRREAVARLLLLVRVVVVTSGGDVSAFVVAIAQSTRHWEALKRHFSSKARVADSA